MRRHTARMAVVLCVLGAVSCRSRAPTLVLRDEHGRTAARVICEDGRFVHRYVHSVHRTAVDEEYVIERDGTLRLTATRFDTLGVGIPYDAEDGFSLENGRFVLKMNRRFHSLSIRVSPVPGHVILAGGREYPLTNWFAPEDLMVATARRATRLPALYAPAGKKSNR